MLENTEYQAGIVYFYMHAFGRTMLSMWNYKIPAQYSVFYITEKHRISHMGFEPIFLVQVRK